MVPNSRRRQNHPFVKLENLQFLTNPNANQGRPEGGGATGGTTPGPAPAAAPLGALIYHLQRGLAKEPSLFGWWGMSGGPPMPLSPRARECLGPDANQQSHLHLTL